MSSDTTYSTYAVSLYFDDAADSCIRTAAAALASATENTALTNPETPPHLTLGMFHAAEADVPELEQQFTAFIASGPEAAPVRAFSLSFGKPDTFLNKVIYLPVQKTEQLESLNRRLHDMLMPRFAPGGNRNYLPERWAPHVALAIKLTKPQMDAGMAALSALALPGGAGIRAVSLARCHPYKELYRKELPSDTLTPDQRHVNMSHIRSTGNSLETSLRSQLFRFGFRFRKNDRRLNGSPDIVFPHYHAVIFVNGCFWHAHGWTPPAEEPEHAAPSQSGILPGVNAHCSKFRFPRSNTEFWLAKFTRNRERDIRDITQLLEQGWRIGIVWECSITGKNRRQKIYDTAARISLWLEEQFAESFMEF